MSSPRYVLVANIYSNNLSVFSVDSVTGRLRFRSYVATGHWPVAIAVHTSGKFAYVANQAVPNQPSSNSVSAYRVGPDGTVTRVGPQHATMSTPVNLAMAPNGKYLYVACYNPTATQGVIEIFAIHPRSGALGRPANLPPVTTAVAPIAVAVNPSGSFLYALSRVSSEILTYSIDSRTGTLSVSGPPLTTDTGPNAIAIAPSGQFVYVASTGAVSGGGTVTTYSLAPATGALSSVASVVVGEVDGLLVHPSGNFAYALALSTPTRQVMVYSVDLSTGTLSPTSTITLGSTFPVQNSTNFGLDPTGQYLYVTFYAANGSNTVTAYAIDPTNGSLSAVPSGVISSGGTWPGVLAVIEGPTPVSYTPKFAYVATDSNVWAYTINAATGALTVVNGSPFAAGSYPGGIAVDPFGRFAYVTNTPYGPSPGNTISAYAIDATTGALTAVPGSPIAAGNGAGPVAVDPSGRFAYVVHTFDNTISAYTIDAGTGQLSPIGSAVATGSSPGGIAVDPSGRFVYVTNYVDNTVSAYTIDAGTGALTAIYGSPFAGEPGPYHADPDSITVDASGRFAYVVMDGLQTVWTYTIDANSGALTGTGPSVIVGGTPYSITADPAGQFVYVTCESGLSPILAYAIDASTGALTAVAGSPFGVGPDFTTSLAVDPSGQFAYVANVAKSTISTYTIDAGSGALTATGSVVATGAEPLFVTTTGTIQ
ncbi:MAG: lactonase family protein [Alphaproteobacteria bacterium]